MGYAEVSVTTSYESDTKNIQPTTLKSAPPATNRRHSVDYPDANNSIVVVRGECWYADGDDAHDGEDNGGDGCMAMEAIMWSHVKI